MGFWSLAELWAVGAGFDVGVVNWTVDGVMEAGVASVDGVDGVDGEIVLGNTWGVGYTTTGLVDFWLVCEGIEVTGMI